MAKPTPSPTAVTDFRTAFPELATGSNTRGMTPSQRKRHLAVLDAITRAEKQKWSNATVVNLHPFALDLNAGYLGHITCPAKKLGDPYFKHVIDKPKIDLKDKGDDEFEVILVFPVELAEDLVNDYKETGGVFCYEGEGEVPAELLAKAREKQLSWYWLLYQEGNSNWAEHRKNPRYITDRMRDAAKELYRLKLIAEQPEWIVLSRNESPDVPCDGCGAIIAKIAKFCSKCNTIFDFEWVKARRPDLYRLQVGLGDAVPGAAQPSFDKFIKEAPQG